MTHLFYRSLAKRMAFWISVLIAILAAASALAIALMRDDAVTKANAALQDALEERRIFLEFRGTLGYGGFIHNFKNYVLRGDPAYLNIAEERLQRAFSLWGRTEQTLDGFGEEKIAITTMLANYSRAMVAAKTGPRESAELLDQLVRVDDMPAVDGLQAIENQVVSEVSRRAVAATDLTRRFDNAIIIAVAAMLVSLFFVALTRSIRRGVQASDARESDLNADKSLLSLQQAQAEELGDFGTWLLRLDDNQVNWSNGIYAIHGRAPEAGLPSFEEALAYYPGDTGQQIQSMIDTAVARKGAFSFRYPLTRDDGETIQVVSAGQYLEYHGHAYMVGVLRDITPEREREEALKRAAVEADKTAKARSSFLAVMSHEIRTPINGVMGVLQLLETMELPDEARELVELGAQSSDQLLAVINDLLEMSRLQSGKVQLIEEPFNIGRVLSAAAGLHAITARQKGIELQIDVPEHSPPVLIGDEVRLKQIVGNLVSNAVKFTLKGHVRVAVSFSEPDDDRAYMVDISVEDTGIGIPENKLVVLFEPFEQVEDAYRRQFGGTGLGLSICKALTDLMGGAISVRSTEGEGTCFTVRLRLVEDDHGMETQMALELQGDIGALEVLVVEDAPLNRNLMEKFLVGRMGLKATFANDGQEALDACAGRTFDAIFMDIQMPVMDGMEATRVIRSGYRHMDQTPIIAVTANVLRDEIPNYFAAGMQHCITKPIDWREVVHVLKNLKSLSPDSGEGLELADLDDIRPGKLLETRAGTQGVDRLEQDLSELEAEVAVLAEAMDENRNEPAPLVGIAHRLRMLGQQYGLDFLSSFAKKLEADIYDPVRIQHMSVQLKAAIRTLRDML